MSRAIQFAESRGPRIRLGRRARAATIEVQLDLEKLLAAAVIEQALLIRSIAPEVLEAARQAFSLALPERISSFDFRVSPVFVERIARLLAAARVLGGLQVRRSAGLAQAASRAESRDLQFGELDKVKPERAIEYLKNLDAVTRRKFDALVAGQRGRAFTIAGVHQQSLLEGMRNLVADSLERGIPLDQFVKDARDLLHSARLSPGRLRTVWNTNVGNALARGREAELREPEVAAVLSWRLFDAMNDSFTRPNHAAGDNGIAPAEWWDGPGADLKPLLGFNCRCVLLAVNAVRAQKLIDSGEATDLRLGIPAGFGPDAGFGRLAA